MYLEIGNDLLIESRAVLGVFDLDNTSWSKRTRAFLGAVNSFNTINEKCVRHYEKFRKSIKQSGYRFRMLTTGHTIIMGRKTFESLPNGALPNRRNIVISKTPRRIRSSL